MIESATNLEERSEQYIQLITDLAMDSNHLPMMVIDYANMRPLEDTDFPEETWRWKESPAGYYAYENTGQMLGGWIAAETIRFLVTGDSQAKQNADQAFDGIRHVYNLGKEKVEGYFPKPYCGKISDQISRDQYEFVLAGLAEYHAIADGKARKEMGHMMGKMVEYWMGLDYVDVYFGKSIDMLEDAVASHFLGTVRFPYTLTGERKFLDEYNRLFHDKKLGERMPETLRSKFLQGETYDGATYFRSAEQCMLMKTMAIDHLWDHDPEHGDLWRHSLEEFWKGDALVALNRDEGLVYGIVGFDPEKNETFLTEPGVIEEIDNEHLQDAIMNWGGRWMTPVSAELALTAAVIGNRLDLQEAVDTAKLILEKMTLEKFRGHTVPDESHYPPGQKWKDFLWTEMIVYWLWTYWLGRHRKLW